MNPSSANPPRLVLEGNKRQPGIPKWRENEDAGFDSAGQEKGEGQANDCSGTEECNCERCSYEQV